MVKNGIEHYFCVHLIPSNEGNSAPILPDDVTING